MNVKVNSSREGMPLGKDRLVVLSDDGKFALFGAMKIVLRLLLRYHGLLGDMRKAMDLV